MKFKYVFVLIICTVICRTSGLFAQITAPQADFSVNTNYTNGAPNDLIHIFCEEGTGTGFATGSLTATHPGSAANWSYIWREYNDVTFTFDSLTTLTGASTTLNNLSSGGYKVVVRDGANVVQQCYVAWVFVNETRAEINSQSADCDTTRTYSSIIDELNDFVYYNPPPEQFPINSATTDFEIRFSAVHTFVSDLAYYLVGPPSCGSPTIQLGDELCCCNSGDDVTSLTFSNTTVSTYDVCILPVPINAGPFDRYGAQGVGPTVINWAGLNGCNALDGGWTVQIYDCVGADVGALTNASLTFTDNSVSTTRCVSPSVTYNSGTINSVINDNSCDPVSASRFTVPLSPTITTPITLVNSIATIQWSTNNPNVTISNGSTGSPTFDGLNTRRFTEIYLQVTDNFGCIAYDTFINEFVYSDTISISPLQACSNAGNFTLSANPPGGTWSGPGLVNASTGEFNSNVLAPGKYAISYQSPNRCDTLRIDTLEMVNQLIAFWTLEDTICDLNNLFPLNSLFTDTTSVGGTWSGPGVVNDSFYNPNGMGGSVELTYTVGSGAVTSCQNSHTDTIVLARLNPITNRQVVNASCPTVCNGEIQITLRNNRNYLVTWEDSIGNVLASTDTILPNACRGFYVAIITDTQRNCTHRDTILVGAGTALNIDGVDSTQTDCFGSAGGSATVNITAGTPPYNFLWNDGLSQTTQTATNLTSGVYTVTVTDNNSCVGIDSVFVPSPAALSIQLDSNNVFCYGDSTGFAWISNIGGGVAPYSYLWNDVMAQTNDTAFNLSIGIYTVTVTDDSGCVTQDSIEIIEPNALEINLFADSANCFGGNSGRASVLTIGGTLPYNYVWNDGLSQSTDTAFNLNAGFYTVTVSDANNCLLQDSIEIHEPSAIVLNMDSADASCFGTADGRLWVTAMGGAGGFTYLWNDAANQITDTALNLSAAITYQVVVTDANGCMDSISGSIGQPNPFSYRLDSVRVRCYFEATGKAIIRIDSGGAAPYNYLWNDAMNQMTPTAFNLIPGSYTVTVTDANSCNLIETVSVPNIDSLSISMYKDDISCFDSADGKACAVVTGGNGGYRYLWDDALAQSTDTAFDLDAALYTINVEDDSGCRISDTISIVEPSALSGIPNQDSTLCFGSTDGKVYVQARGGTSPYSYTWNDPMSQSTDTAFNVAAGFYTVTITDTNGCNYQTTQQVLQPPALEIITLDSVNATCFGYSDGRAIVTVQGGTGSYGYLWNDVNVQSNSTATGLPAGSYSVTVTDANNCTVSDQITVNQPPRILPFILSSEDPSCFGFSNGGFIVGTTAGVAPFIYRINSVVNASDTFTSIPAGTYTVVVEDDNGCTDSVNVTLTDPPILSFNLQAQAVSCFGYTDGSITVTPTGGIAPYRYSIDTGNSYQASNVFNNLGQGTYLITVEDANGCMNAISITVTEPNLFQITTVVDSVLCAGSSTGRIEIQPTGGTLPFNNFTYQLNGASVQNSTSPIISNLIAGQYFLQAIDGNNCIAFDTAMVLEPLQNTYQDSLIPTSCFGDDYNDGELFINGFGFNPPFEFSVDGGPFLDQQNFRNLSFGPHTIIARDANGCLDTLIRFIEQPDPIIPILNPVADTVELGESITVTSSVINPPDSIRFAWNPETGLSCADCPNPIISTFDDEVYTLTIFDASRNPNELPCFGTAQINVVVEPEQPYFVPNMFTPNNDGVNDVLYVFGEDIASMSLEIYDRWGERVYLSNNQGEGWNGLYKDQMLGNGVYVYSIHVVFLNGKTSHQTGSITLLR